ncbi:uncharacterized protein C8Q71DRAFT_534329 [Rhodofomes roseus]|uniref:F-box domain-containing protein n=1 Tax=Rhodofomes roseus TaxID=34475 RepID=A0ABQ8KKB0_9APHY|nr:uncharacterized protein C8Q71DRAFT_534329 [Rhodofomes roseus]KAH9838521.1 hypothetical protein C8Q71DRAFT_534329 [Rhodofomes roseus]
MPLLGLPPELLERVLDILYDDPPSLSACSLTCWALLLVARLRLFRTVKLGTTRQCLRFLSSLETSSEINGGMSNGAFVRVLILPAKMGLERRNRRAALRMDLVKQILRRVPNVETLDMCRFEWYKLSGLACPNGIDVDPRDAVKTIFAFPRLKALLLREIVPHSMTWMVTGSTTP